MNRYRPQRTRAKWIEGSPQYVLAVYDQPGAIDRYTVFVTDGMYHIDGGAIRAGADQYHNTWIPYFGASGNPTHPQGFGQWSEMEAYRVAQYRYANSHHKIRWLDLPPAVRDYIEKTCKEGN